MKDVVTSPQRRGRYRREGLWTDETLATAVQRHARERPDSIAVVDGRDGRRVSYGQLVEDAIRIAAHLRSRGVGPGDAVSVQLPNRYETVVADLAVLLLGGVLNPLLPDYREHELRGILRRAGSRAFITPGTHRGFDFIPMARTLCDELNVVHLPVDDSSASETPEHLTGVLSAPVPEFDVGIRGADEVSEVIFTSGTESTPKAVMHTEQTTTAAVRLARDALGLTDGDVVWMPSPVGHSTGLNYGMRLALHLGLPLVLQDRWDASDALQLVRSEGCTYTVAATTFLSDLVSLAEQEKEDLCALGVFGCGGAPVPAELVRRAAAVGITVLRLYGSTEALVVTWNRPDSPEDKRESTDGLPLDHMEASIRDDDEAPLPPGKPGELWIRGPSGSVGYFADEERTSVTYTPEGWIRSGDLGVMDEDGYLSIVGRKKEIIIRGGLNIAPREIEDLISEMPGVQSVAVIGVPDARLGEKLCACVVPAAGADPVTFDELVGFLRARHLATYKLPQRLVVMDGLPRTASGKIQKGVLSEQVAART